MIAVQAMLGLVEPQSSGLGGGAFLLYWDASSKTLSTFDARETAPARATPERFLLPDGTKMSFADAIAGGQSVGVPGVPKLMEITHALYGKKPWGSLFQPAIDTAEDRVRGLSPHGKLDPEYDQLGHATACLSRCQGLFLR